MRGPYYVIDVDAHYLEPVAGIAEYVDEPWRTRIKGVTAEKLVPAPLGDRMLQGRIRRDDVDYGFSYGVSTKDQIIGLMARLGIDATILVANRLTTIGHLSSRDLAVALANGYIDFMLDRVADPNRGLYTMPILPAQEPELAAQLLDRVADHAAVVGACFMSSGVHPPLGDLRYTPVYEVAEQHNLPIVFHSSPGLTLTEGASPVDGAQRLIEAHSLGFSISNQIQLTSLLLQGVPERFPKLKFVFQEAGVFWIPMVMYRLDEYYLKRREEAPLLKMLPSEYVLDRCFFGTQPLEVPKQSHHLKSLFEMADGFNHFLYASDYPHFDFDDPVVITNLPFLTGAQKQAVLGGNAFGVFNFEKGGVAEWRSTSSDRVRGSRTAPII